MNEKYSQNIYILIFWIFSHISMVWFKNGVFFRTLQHMYKQQSRGQFHFGDKATDEEYDGKDVDSG